MKPNDLDELNKYLFKINCSKRSICEGMIRSMDLASSSGEVSELITNSLLSKIKVSSIENPVDLKVVFAHLFLISDILFNT